MIAPLNENLSPGQVRARLDWRCDPLPAGIGGLFLPYGFGRSYGDVCLNRDGVLLDCRPLRHLISFDAESGLLTAEAGISVDEILAFSVPQGWFLPVVPGTKYVTLGGAIANDIHGKNHHSAGAFGCHVERFRLRRSDGSEWLCDRSQNPDLFFATIGGLGLTGVILWAAVRLRPIRSSFLSVESIPFAGIDAFWKINEESAAPFEHTVAWLDGASLGPERLRGIYHRGNPADEGARLAHPGSRWSIPRRVPDAFLNRIAIRALNEAYYWKNSRKRKTYLQPYDPFFFPLDGILNWQRLYGRRGLFQYQCAIPPASARPGTAELFEVIRKSGRMPYLAVMKTFGERASGGWLSFPRPGITIALDFPGPETELRTLFQALNERVMRLGGALYPAKDSQMEPAMFRAGFPNYARFLELVDAGIRSDFAKRVGLVK